MSSPINVARADAQPRASIPKGRIGFGDFALIAAQLVLLLVLLRQFQIEGRTFVELAALTFIGFAVHAFLPLAWRLPFFAALSLGSIAFVLGLINATWICAIGAVLVGICHLRTSIEARAALLVATGAMLIAQRSQLLPVPWSEAIWPILGSMFMFRLIVYFYDLRHDKVAVTPVQTVSYFAMLPNVCFPLFPVIDFKTYRRSHYSADARATYQKGVDWIVRGVIHLILYRYFYYHVTLAPSEVDTPAELLQYLVANFMLYLRVSGLFHLVVGMLHLFGFNLPETHNRYLLASSFTDFWRRINIYWKDFMQKIFYFPAVFALKRFGSTRAVMVATLYVFVLTWFLHSYQWFWLRGSWLFAWHDALFWAILGVLVVVNSLYEIKHGRSRSLGAPTFSLRSVMTTIAKTYATFWFICVLWSFWTSESIADWLSLWSALRGEYTLQVLFFPLLALAVIAIGCIPLDRGPAGRSGTAAAARLQRRERAVTIAALVLALAVSIESVHTRLGTEIASTVHSLRSAHLSRLDNAKLERGYYEGLLSVDRFNSQLWEVYSKKPANWQPVDVGGLKRFVGGFAQIELVPSFVSMTQYGPMTTNRFGLRDKEYAETPPSGALRAAVLGASSVMGWGVPDGATFEALVEARLNREGPPGGYRAYELLNYGVAGYQPPQQLAALERALRLQPNAVFYVASGRELRRSAAYMAEAVRKQLPIPYPRLQQIVAQAGVRPEMDEATALKVLEPFGSDIARAVYEQIVSMCRERGIKTVWIFVPQVRAGSWQEETGEATRLAQAAGFSIVSLEGSFDGHDVDRIRLAEWDDHPNAMGHKLVADKLFEALVGPAAAVLKPNAK